MNRPVDPDLDDRPPVDSMDIWTVRRHLVSMSRNFAEEVTENRKLKRELAALIAERDLQKGRIFRLEREVIEILDQVELCQVEADLIRDLAKARAANAELRKVCQLYGFFVSAIKSGEPWTNHCEAVADKFRAVLAERVDGHEPGEWFCTHCHKGHPASFDGFTLPRQEFRFCNCICASEHEGAPDGSRFSRILCWLGWHRWTWRFVRGTTLKLNDSPPDHARCSRCGQIYKS